MVYSNTKRNIKFRYCIIINLAVFIFLMVTLEAVARLIFPKEDKLEEILNVLEQDPVLFWRQRPNLEVMFQGVKVETNQLGFRDTRNSYDKNKNVFRIVCLGASPTFGWAAI